MKICVFGAGAIGSYLGAMLAGTDAEVSLVARGPHLAAMRARGLTLLTADGERRNVRLHCTDDAGELGPQDFVVLTLKAHAVAPALAQIRPLLGARTAIVTAQNGILWWYFHKLAGPWENHHLEAADPGRRIWDALGPERAIGCVVYPSCELVEPGVVRHLDSNRCMLGEPDGSRSARVTALSQVMTSAGLKAPVRSAIRDDTWLKLIGNATFNPLSVLTRSTLQQLAGDEAGRALVRALMGEAMAVAEALGVRFPIGMEQRIDGAAQVGEHKTSMLQDFEAGRALELDALVAAVTEIGRLAGVPTPNLDLALALTRFAERVARAEVNPAA